MRASLMRRIAKNMIARDAALLVLASDSEVSWNSEHSSVAFGRTLQSLQSYNPKITHKVMWELAQKDLVEFVGSNYRIKYKSNIPTRMTLPT